MKPPLDDLDYKAYIMKNGLRVILCSDPTSNSAGAAMDVHEGACSDPSDIPGLAHFNEHMLFLGTKDYPKEDSFETFLAANGGTSNAYTSSEDIVYHFALQAEEDYLQRVPPVGNSMRLRVKMPRICSRITFESIKLKRVGKTATIRIPSSLRETKDSTGRQQAKGIEFPARASQFLDQVLFGQSNDSCDCGTAVARCSPSHGRPSVYKCTQSKRIPTRRRMERNRSSL